MSTSKPLIIVVHPSLEKAPWVAELQAKGHLVYTDKCSYTDIDIWAADLILGPNCMRLIPGMEKFLDSFLKGARMIRYPGSKKESQA